MRRVRMTRLFPALLAVAAGCDAQPRGTTADTRTAATSSRLGDEFVLAPAPQPLKPDLTRLGFDPSSRTLTLYELPEESSRWMLASPAAPGGVPVDREYKFPPDLDLDLDRVHVFYTVPNSRPSPSVSLREIIDAREARVLR